jgi:hypothetical protein
MFNFVWAIAMAGSLGQLLYISTLEEGDNMDQAWINFVPLALLIVWLFVTKRDHGR